LAESPQDAHIVIEVMARRSGKTLPTQIKADRCYLLFTIGAGGKLDATRFERVPLSWRPGKFGYSVWRLSTPKPERPVFVLESYNGGGSEFGCHGEAANAASVAIDKFIEDNGALLTVP
jgi:hypothetical protein